MKRREFLRGLVASAAFAWTGAQLPRLLEQAGAEALSVSHPDMILFSNLISPGSGLTLESLRTARERMTGFQRIAPPFENVAFVTVPEDTL